MSTDTETRLACLEGTVKAKVTGTEDLTVRVDRLEQFALQSLYALVAPEDILTELGDALGVGRIAEGKAAAGLLATRVEYLEKFARECLRQLARVPVESTVARLKEALDITGPADGTPGTPENGDGQ